MIRSRRSQVGEDGSGREKRAAGGGTHRTSAPASVTARQGKALPHTPTRGRGFTAAPSLLRSPRRQLAERRRVLGLRERERGARRSGQWDPRAAAAGADGLHLGAGLPAGEDLPAPEVPGGLGAEEAGSCLASVGDTGGYGRKQILHGLVGSEARPSCTGLPCAEQA